MVSQSLSPAGRMPEDQIGEAGWQKQVRFESLGAYHRLMYGRRIKVSNAEIYFAVSIRE
jgi:hypothetical protein